MSDEREQVDRLAELHNLIIDIRDNAVWPTTIQGDYLASTMRSIARFSESIIWEALKGRYSIALVLSRHAYDSSRHLLDLASDDNFNTTLTEPTPVPDTGEVLVPDEKVRSAILSLIISSHLTVLMLTLLSLRSVDGIDSARLKAIGEILPDWNDDDLTDPISI